MTILERYNLKNQPNSNNQYFSNMDYPTDKESYHCYLSGYYSEAFENFNCKNLLEIGINYGGSLRLWHDHFKNSKIYGLDIDIEPSKAFLPQTDRIIIKKIDAYSQQAIEYLSNIRFDIIIDDGPHTMDSLVYVVHHYPKLLSDNGILILEDIQSISWIEKLAQQLSSEYRYMVKDLRAIKNRYDDILMIISKK